MPGQQGAPVFSSGAGWLIAHAQVETDLQPLAVLDILQTIENDLGRARILDKGPRTIDLDMLLYDFEHISHDRLVVPHKLMLEREFVLRPLAE